MFVNLYISNTALADENDWDEFHKRLENKKINFQKEKARHMEEMDQFRKDHFGTEDPFDTPFFKNARGRSRTPTFENKSGQGRSRAPIEIDPFQTENKPFFDKDNDDDFDDFL